MVSQSLAVGPVGECSIVRAKTGHTILREPSSLDRSDEVLFTGLAEQVAKKVASMLINLPGGYPHLVPELKPGLHVRVRILVISQDGTRLVLCQPLPEDVPPDEVCIEIISVTYQGKTLMFVGEAHHAHCY